MLFRSDGPVRYEGRFYGQTDEGLPLDEYVSVTHLVELLRSIPNGTSELSCHPAARSDAPGTYRDERVLELATLCDPAVRAAVDSAGISLRAFGPSDR